jgi:hypothetical protein
MKLTIQNPDSTIAFENQIIEVSVAEGSLRNPTSTKPSHPFFI